MLVLFSADFFQISFFQKIHSGTLSDSWDQISKAKIKKKTVFRVTWPYLNLLVKPRIFFRFSEKDIIFKMHKIIYFFQKKNN